MGFSDHLPQPPQDPPSLDRIGDVDGGDDDMHEEDPAPEAVEGAEVFELWTTAPGGKRVVPDERPPREAVEREIERLRLNPAEIRNERLLTVRDAAAFLGVTEGTLKAWRDRGENLPYYLSPPSTGHFRTRRIHYRVADLIRYRDLVLTRISPTTP